MAEGIRRRHSAGCASRKGRRCNCDAGWEASVYVAREKKRITKSFRREAEAKRWRVDARRAVERGELGGAPRDARTLAEALREFVAGMEGGTVRPKGRKRYKPNTIRSYERAVRLHIVPSSFGSMGVGEVGHRELQALADELLDSTDLSARSVNNIFNPIQAFYRWRLARREIDHNPSEGVDIPIPRSKRPQRIASRSEAAELIDALPVEEQAIWATAFYAGLRRGELQALRVDRVDFERRVIRVANGWDQVEGEIDPKSDAGDRDIPLTGLLRGYLTRHIELMGRGGRDLLFGRTRSDSFVSSTIDNHAKAAWTAANQARKEAAQERGEEPSLLRPLTLHDCRHTFASLLIDAGANAKAVQAFMGHSKIQTTFDTYGHLLPGSHDEVRARMDAYLA